MNYDRIIIGGGLYGLYAAEFCGRKREKILVLECETEAFSRATYINQARVHMGYHYPRSYSTAIKSAKYFDRFCEDFGFCIHSAFEQIYATSHNYSWTNAEQFQKFCDAADIKCQSLNPDLYFKKGMCDGAFLTQEYTYDAMVLKEYFLNKLKQYKNVNIKYKCTIASIYKKGTYFFITDINGNEYVSEFILNASYASVNQILDKMGYRKFNIKYELCEIILCRVNENLKGKGITVMDGPFFSIMPFGMTGFHSLTAVTFTPHDTSFSELPTFKCQKPTQNGCSPNHLANCNLCSDKPRSSWEYMSNIVKKYLKEEFRFEYYKSLYSMKPILKESEIDDSRPTVIRFEEQDPAFVSVLSGKINTVYDLEDVLT